MRWTLKVLRTYYAVFEDEFFQHCIFRKDFMHLMIQLKNRGKVTDDEQIFSKDDKVDKANTFDEDNITAQCLIFFIAGYVQAVTFFPLGQKLDDEFPDTKLPQPQ